MADRSLPSRIEGFAIVSEDGMLADAHGIMPDSLKFEADKRFFEDGMDGVDASIHGRYSHEMHPHSGRRKRITLTQSVPAIAPDPGNAKGILWNPSGASFEQAWGALNLPGGSLGVVGGTRVFEMFLPRYDIFYLTRAPGVRLPGGVPVFAQVPDKTPEAILTFHGLRADAPRMLDAGKNLTVTAWRR
ncbi:MAG: dihydrofolate reductase [Pseudolabrys sp.]|nr:dihydrofolate reductase [Pseudolabrys sp.]